MNCQCGEEAVHEHEIDGNRKWFCPVCHAVVKYISTQTPGMDLALAISLARDERESLLEYFAQEDPVPLELEIDNTLPATTNQQSLISSVQVPSEQDQFFIPLKEDHHEIVRRPPQMSISST